MDVRLSPELEKRLQELLTRGKYPSADDLLSQALDALEPRDRERERKLEQLRRELQLGLDQLERGEYTTLETDEDIDRFFDTIIQEGRERLREKQKKSA